MEANSPGGVRPPSKHVVEVYRVRTGIQFTCRLLAYSPLGLLCHWDRARKRSEYCIGKDCPAALHKSGTLWKGYAPMEVWDGHQHLWFPFVLEVTESLEQDMSNLAARGQVWQIVRTARGKKSTGRIAGHLLEERDPSTFPAAFNVLPVLKSCYHCAELELTVRNPIPPRTVLSPSNADGPSVAEDPSPEPLPNSFSFTEAARRQRQAKNGQLPT